MVSRDEIEAKLNELNVLIGDLTGTGQTQMAVGAKMQEIRALIEQIT